MNYTERNRFEGTVACYNNIDIVEEDGFDNTFENSVYNSSVPDDPTHFDRIYTCDEY